MDSVASISLLALVFGLYFVYRVFTRKSYKFPPGPSGLPLFGNLFSIKPSTAHLNYMDLAKQFGEVMTINIAGLKVLVLNSSQSIKEAFVAEETRDAFAGRPDSFYTRYCDRGPSTAFRQFDDVWKLQRQFHMKMLKIFDGGKHSMENLIKDQLRIAVQKIEESDGEPFYLKSILMPTLANILSILLIDNRYDFDDPAMLNILTFEDLDSRILTGHTVNVLTVFPFLRQLPVGVGKLYRGHQEAVRELLDNFFEIPKKAYNPSVERGNMVNILLGLQRDNPWLKDENIQGMILETFGAGLGTTRGSVRAFFLMLLHRPEVMRRIQKEIDEVIGRDRPPTVADKAQMPYTEAATMESLRFVSATPLGVPRSLTSDVHFRNYFLPKNTVVVGNQWAAHHDEAVWGDPWVYRPERYLDEDGDIVSIDNPVRQNWVPFGAGRRLCLGETFARSRIFLIITTFLQNFDFLPCVGEPLPPFDPREFETGIVLDPPKYLLRAVPREK